MRPAARIEAAIEILGAIEAGISNLGMPADAVFAQYCRKRRYIGSKDRRAISSLVYGVIRSRAKQLWRIEAVGLKAGPRTLVISYLHMTEPDSLSAFAEGGEYAPVPFNDEEKQAVAEAFPKLRAEDMPANVVLELPAWLEESFLSRFAADYEAAIASLNEGAPFDVRRNPFIAVDDMINEIRKYIEDIDYNKYSPIGYRSYKRNNIQDSPLYRNGQIEIQDEAAQLACYLVEAKPGMQIIDLCAGAGGKSLLLSALMNNTGSIQAVDVSGRRLAELKKRAERSGCTNIDINTVPVSGESRDNKISQFINAADRVVVDAPCSGTGTWRRNPDQRWRLSPQQIEEYTSVQQGLLSEAARLVKQGGRLVYMTCSILEAENEAIVAGFMEQRGESWKTVAYSDVWPKVLSTEMPKTLSSNASFLQLAPHQHQTDGFFIAILEKL